MRPPGSPAALAVALVLRLAAPAIADAQEPGAPASGDVRAADSLARLALPGLCARWALDSLAVQPSIDALFDRLAPHRAGGLDSLLDCARRSRDFHVARRGAKAPAAAAASVRLALLLDGADRWNEARGVVLDAWPAIRALGASDPVLLSDALFVLGRADHFLTPGILTDSLLAASVRLRVATLGAGDPRSGLAFEWLGRTQVRGLHFDAAESSFAAANAGLLRLHGRTLELAEYEIWRGNYLFQQEEHARVRDHYLRARAIREAALPADHPDLARSIGLVANVEFRLGRLEVAQALYRRADAILSARDPVSRTALVNRSNLGALLLELGDFDEARALLEGVVAERARLLPNHFQIAGALSNLATALHGLDRNEEALVYCALADSAYRLQGDPSNRIRHESTWSEILAATGRTHEALAHAHEAIMIARTSTDAGDPRRAVAEDAAGVLLLDLGRLADARRVLERAAAGSDSAFGPDHPLALQARAHMARLEHAEGHDERAAEIAFDVERRSSAAARAVIGALSEREALRYATVRPSGLPLLFELAGAATPADSLRTTRTWEAWIPARALVLEATAERARAMRHAESDPLVRRAEEARSAYAALLVRAQLGRRGDEAAGRLDAARRAFEDADRAVAGRVDFAGEVPDEPSATEIATALPAGSALVAIVAAEAVATGRDGTYLAFLVRAGRALPEVVTLGGVGRIDSLLARWFEQARRSPAGMTPAERGRLEHATAKAGGALRAAVLDPVRARLPGVRDLFWVSDGALHLLNPVALPAARGDRYVLDEDVLFHLLTTERELLRPSRAPDSTSTRRLLAVGGVDFATAAGPFRPLPASLAEAQDVAARWTARAGQAARLLTGAEATEPALRRACPGRAVVHIATHGIFGAGRAGLGGLALAGVAGHDSASSGDDDGVLTEPELAGLDLSAAEWLVLSGCETGRATALAGEGVFGLRRAGQVAGARTVIASLWPVGDAGTRMWMRELYAARQGSGRSTAEAARDASRAVLAKSRHARLSTHPSAWAGFVAVGR